MSGRNKKKSGIQMSVPEPPAFLQRMREQIVANEDAERRERNEKRRLQRPARPQDPDDDPTVVKVNDEDLTEAEYKRMKLELETQYKLNANKQSHRELDVDDLIKSRQSTSSSTKQLGGASKVSSSRGSDKKSDKTNFKNKTKTLSYGSSSSSSSEEDEEDAAD